MDGMRSTLNILLIYPEFPDTFWSFKYALKFVAKAASNPPLGLLTIASMLPADWNKRLVDMNVESLRQKDLEWADYVFISAMVVQRKSVNEVIERCKISGKTVVAGGPLFTSEHENFPQVDHFILNEGELTLPPFLEDLSQGKPQRVYSSEKYADVRTTPIPMYELLDLKKYECMTIQFSRGCPFNCDFCNVTALLGHIPRTKTTAQIIAELDKMYRLGWRRNVFFVDDNFIGNKKILKEEVLPALIEWRKGKIGFSFITEASVNLADDPELMRLMSEAGFVSVFVGVETPDEEGLQGCHKLQNKGHDLVASVKRLHSFGLQVMGGFIVGFDTDAPSIFQRQIDFIQASGIITAMVGLLQAPYGTQLYQRMQSEGRLIEEMSGDNADGTTNIIPKMNSELLHAGYQRIMDQIYSPKLFYQRVRTFMKDFNPRKSSVPIDFQQIMGLFRTIYRIGLTGNAKKEYWKLFFWTLFTCPEKFPLAITMSVYGYHFTRVASLHLKRSGSTTGDEIDRHTPGKLQHAY